ncbi:MAG TPA: PEP-CTERM sorting domain-containing protein [Verrucomicrobiae bacterium]
MTAKNSLMIGLTLVLTSLSALAQTTYNGNGNGGFGGPVGNGSLTLRDDGASLTFTFNAASSLGGNDLVIYIDSIGGGYSSTAGFMDAADGGRSAVSGYTSNGNSGGSGQSILNFTTGFLPDYASDIQSGYASLFGLNNGGNSSLNYITGASQSGSSPYTLTVPLLDLGLTPGAAQSFELFGSLVSETGYRSNEALPGNVTGSQGWGNLVTQTGFETYISTVPEPSSLALAGFSGLATFFAIRRRR